MPVSKFLFVFKIFSTMSFCFSQTLSELSGLLKKTVVVFLVCTASICITLPKASKLCSDYYGNCHFLVCHFVF